MGLSRTLEQHFSGLDVLWLAVDHSTKRLRGALFQFGGQTAIVDEWVVPILLPQLHFDIRIRLVGSHCDPFA